MIIRNGLWESCLDLQLTGRHCTCTCEKNVLVVHVYDTVYVNISYIMPHPEVHIVCAELMVKKYFLFYILDFRLYFIHYIYCILCIIVFNK